MNATSKAERYQIIDDCAHVLSDAGNLMLRRLLGYDSGGGCWASAATLADDMAWSLTKVRETLRQLHGKGFIWVQHDRGGSRAVRRINWPTLLQDRRAKVDRAESRTVKSQSTVRKSDLDRAESTDLTVRNSAPELSTSTSTSKTHTPRTRTREDPTDGGTCTEQRVCVREENPEPEPPNPATPKPARQGGDAGRRQGDGPPESEVVDADAKFTILAAAYGPQGGLIGKASSAFAAVADEYDAILRHVNATAKQREKQRPESRLWLWAYLESAPWRYETGPKAPGELSEDAKRVAAIRASYGLPPLVPEPPPPPPASERVVEDAEIEPPPVHDDEHEDGIEPEEPDEPGIKEDWHQQAAEQRARAAGDIGESAELVQGLTELIRAKTEPEREPRKVEIPKPKPCVQAPKVSETIEDKIRFAAKQGLTGAALLDIARRVDRDKRSDAELRELVERVTGACEAEVA